jgi:hypothetical protein
MFLSYKILRWNEKCAGIKILSLLRAFEARSALIFNERGNNPSKSNFRIISEGYFRKASPSFHQSFQRFSLLFKFQIFSIIEFLFKDSIVAKILWNLLWR